MRVEATTNLLPLRQDRPVHFPVPKFVPTASYVGVHDKTPEKKVDSGYASPVESSRNHAMLAQSPITVDSAHKEKKVMQLTLKGLSKNGKTAFYTGAANTIRVGVAAFTNKTAPQTIDVADGIFAGARQPKAKLTPEERKAARAAAPKLTLAQKIEKRRAALAKLEAKAAAGDANATM